MNFLMYSPNHHFNDRIKTTYATIHGRYPGIWKKKVLNKSDQTEPSTII